MAATRKPRRGARAKERLWGAPAPSDFKRTRTGRELTEAARLHLKRRGDIDRLLAVEKLAIDVFADSAAARAFATNPEAYMAQAGLSGVRLDLNSREVRLAMAMGDPEVRRAAAEGDAVAFVRAVMDQGFAELTVGTLGGVIVVEFVAHASIALTAVAIAVTRTVSVTKTLLVTETKVTEDGGTILTRQIDMLTRMAEQLAAPRLARAIRTPSTRKLLERYVELQLRKR